MYVKNEYHLGKVIQVENHYPGNYGAPGQKRRPKRERTPAEMARQNQTNRRRKIQRLILANFKEGDWHLILKYKPGQRPESYERAQKSLKNFLDRLRKEYKKRGYELKYIAITERGKKGQALHHHVVIQDINTPELSTVDMVKKLWNGFNTFIDLYDEGDYEKLAEYIVKIETKDELEQGKASYSRSRNLITPKPKKKIMLRKIWPEIPKPKKGWYVDKSTIYNGFNPVTERPYQYYTMRKIEKRGSP